MDNKLETTISGLGLNGWDRAVAVSEAGIIREKINKSTMPKAMLGRGAEGVTLSTVGFGCNPRTFEDINAEF